MNDTASNCTAPFAKPNVRMSRLKACVTDDLENRMLRQAIRQNLVSFPAQVPVFERQSRPDLQHKVVTLYFVCGWTMDQVAEHYGLARQRIGQILTAWRIRATKEGYIQEIEGEHPLFRRIREVQDRPTEPPVRAISALRVPVGESSTIVPSQVAVPTFRAPETVDAPAWRADAQEYRSDITEELEAIVCVLNNQLELFTKTPYGNVDSCEPLLGRASLLCARLETQLGSPRSNNNDKRSTEAALSAANALLKRFHEYTAERTRLPFEPVFARTGRLSNTTHSSG